MRLHEPSRIWTGSVFTFLLALVATGGSGLAGEPGSRQELDVVYTKVGDTELKLDIACPTEGKGPFPAVFVIHGGGWRMGNKDDVARYMPELNRSGYVAVSPQYRFCPKDVFPAQVHDVKAAVRWLKANAAKYQVDPNQIGAFGFSAGGHLSLMLGLTSEKDGLEGDVKPGEPDSRIQAVVNYYGPTDLGADDIPAKTRPLFNDFLGQKSPEKPELSARASPLTYVSAGDAPVLTFQGTKDPLVPYSQAIKLSEAMNKAGIPGRVELMIGEKHGWKGDERTRTLKETIAFFDLYLKTPAKPN